MNKYIAVKIGLWLFIVFMMIVLFGWDLIDDMESLQLEAKVIENSNRQNHNLHDLELDVNAK